MKKHDRNLDWFWGWWDPVAFLQSQLPEPSLRPWQEAFQDADRYRYRLTSLWMGDKPGVVKGQGLDLLNLREYQPGDDLRKMDWNVYARTATPHVREYHEEKQQVFWFVLDFSPSMWLGFDTPKVERLYWLLESLLPILDQQGHRVGIVWFDEDKQEIIKPLKGTHGIQSLLQKVRQVLLKLEVFRQSVFRQSNVRQNSRDSRLIEQNAFLQAMTAMANLVRRGQRVVFFGDFNLPLSQRKPLEMALGRCHQKATVLAVSLLAPHEVGFPDRTGSLILAGLEGDTTGGVLTHVGIKQKTQIQNALMDWEEHKAKQLGSACHWLAVVVDEPIRDQVMKILKSLHNPSSQKLGASARESF